MSKRGRWVKWVWQLCVVGALLALSLPANAELTIDISGGTVRQFSIAMLPFGETGSGETIQSVIRADLTNTGLFQVLESYEPGPALNAPMPFDEWKQKGADALVAGEVQPRGDGRYAVSFRLFDVAQQSPLAGESYIVGASQIRQVAHQIANVIYEKLTGDVGVFNTHILFVTRSGHSYALKVADYDGYGAQTIVSSPQPLMSPTWSPDGTHVAYVGFNKGKPVIYIQALAGGRRVLANFKGSNSAPAFASDGHHLAIVLTRDGNSQIYRINSDGSGLQRLSRSDSIDTEPTFSPDGRWIAFTSDRDGSPQIFQMPASGGDAKRLTFAGDYNVSPHYSPDGKSLTYVQRANGGYHISTLDLATGQAQVLTEANNDESPSFSPNGKMILYATKANGQGVLALTSSDGRARETLATQHGDVRDPEWSPVLSRKQPF